MKGLWGCFSLGGGFSRVEFGGGEGGPFKEKQTARISVGSHGKMAKLPMLPYRYTGCSLPRAIPSSPGAQVQRASPGLSYPSSFALRGAQKNAHAEHRPWVNENKEIQAVLFESAHTWRAHLCKRRESLARLVAFARGQGLMSMRQPGGRPEKTLPRWW